MGNRTYCMNLYCPIEGCAWHLSHAKSKYVRIAPYDDNCKMLFSYLKKALMRDGKDGDK